MKNTDKGEEERACRLGQWGCKDLVKHEPFPSELWKTRLPSLLCPHWPWSLHGVILTGHKEATVHTFWSPSSFSPLSACPPSCVLFFFSPYPSPSFNFSFSLEGLWHSRSFLMILTLQWIQAGYSVSPAMCLNLIEELYLCSNTPKLNKKYRQCFWSLQLSKKVKVLHQQSIAAVEK